MIDKHIGIILKYIVSISSIKLMADSKKKPQIEYRVELEKKIQINKSFSERRNQAVAMRILSYGLFGQKRYQNLYLTCSLNCFHLALKIANTVHQRVAGLAMIIRFETVQVLEYYMEEVDGKYFEEKKFSKITIKLTKNPTEDDKKQPGFNPGLSADEIQQPLTDVLKRKKDSPGPKTDRRTERRPQRRQQDRHQSPKKRDQRQGRGFRQDHNERIDEDGYRRGERKTRGFGKNQSMNMNRGGRDNFNPRKPNQTFDNRGQKQPRRGRYDDEDD